MCWHRLTLNSTFVPRRFAARHVCSRAVTGQASLLQSLGCTSAHGYYFSGAVPADDFTSLLDHRFAL